MHVKDKFDSTRLMSQLGINCVPNVVVKLNDLEAGKLFIEKYPAEEYCMRNLKSVMGGVNFPKNYDEFCEMARLYEEEVWFGVSVRPYQSHKVLLGDIRISKEKNIVDMVAKIEINSNHRNLYDNPTYQFVAIPLEELLDKNDIEGLDEIIFYCIKHSLYDTYVEFVVYDCPIGTKQENVLILELRTDY